MPRLPTKDPLLGLDRKVCSVLHENPHEVLRSQIPRIPEDPNEFQEIMAKS